MFWQLDNLSVFDEELINLEFTLLAINNNNNIRLELA
jgi:hypothetical protein